MKYIKVAAITILIAAIVAVAVAYLRRDSIARDIANAVLEGQDLAVTDLSVRSLQTDRVEFREIVLRRNDGTEFVIDGLSFPLSFPSVRPEHISIDSLTVRSGQGDAVPPRYGETLKAILELPENLPSTAVTLARLSIPDIPEVTGIVWAVTEQMQRLTFGVASVSGFAEIRRSDDDGHRLTVRTATAADSDILLLDLEIDADAEGLVLAGPATVRITPLLPTLKSLGILPADIESLDARLDGPTRIRVANAGPIMGQTSLSPGNRATARYRADNEVVVDVRLVESDPVEIGVEFPSLEWSANTEQLEIALVVGSLSELPVRIGNVECRSTSQCNADLHVATSAFHVPGLEIGQLEVAASVAISTGAALTIDVSEETVLRLGGLKSTVMSADSVQMSNFSGARFNARDETWHVTADGMELAIENAIVGEDITATLPVSIENLRITEGGNSLLANFTVTPDVGTLGLGEIATMLPGVHGNVNWQSGSLHTAFEISDANGAVSAQIDASHDTSNGRGNVDVRDASFSFDQKSLSERALDWPYDWDVVAGTLAAEGSLSWAFGDDGGEYRGSMDFEADGLAGRYADIAFAGLNSTVPLRFDSASGPQVPRAHIEVALLDVGLPLEHLAVDLSVRGEQTLMFDNFSLSALGGRILADPFRFTAANAVNEILVRPQSVQLQFMADLAGFESIEVSGSLSGTLPVSIEDESITIKSGSLESDPPGGVIRYAAGAAVDGAAPGSGLTVVSQALTNFEFDSLTSEVNYTEGGDLSLQMRLSGNNPDLDPTQPINLNLGVENNIPQLLRSLQAVRNIEDVLERETQN